MPSWQHKRDVVNAVPYILINLGNTDGIPYGRNTIGRGWNPSPTVSIPHTATQTGFPTVVVKIVYDDFGEGFGNDSFRNSSLTAYAHTLALPTERHTGRSLRSKHKREGMEPLPYSFHTAYGNTGGIPYGRNTIGRGWNPSPTSTPCLLHHSRNVVNAVPYNLCTSLAVFLTSLQSNKKRICR